MTVILDDSEGLQPSVSRSVRVDFSSLPKVTFWDLIALGVPLASLSALLYMQVMFLWSKQHLQFFPMAVVAACYFLWSEADGAVPVARSRQKVARLLLMPVLFCVVFSATLFSSWLSHATAVFAFWVWALGRIGSISTLRLVGVTGLLAITVPIPLGGDRALIAWLQDVSTTACCSIMDVCRIIHLRSGNVIEIAEKPLFVEEACSGVDSQYALMAVAGTLLLVGRASFIVSLATIITVPIWAILGNILRILSIVLGLEWGGFDLSEGTNHTLLGLLCFSLAAWAHWSSVQFLNFVECCVGGAVFQPAPSPASTSVDSRESIDFPSGKFRFLWFAPLLIAPFGWFVVLAGAEAVELPVISDETVRGFPGAEAEFLKASGVSGITSGVRYSETARDRDDFLGQRSRTWVYLSPQGVSVVSLDMPFRGFHELWECYIRTGWVIDRMVTVNVLDHQTGEDWPVYEVQLRNKMRDYATLHFSYFDRNGSPYLQEQTREFQGTRDRSYRTILQEVASMASKLQGDKQPLTFQFQMLTRSKSPHSLDQISELRERYSQIRSSILWEMRPVLMGLPTHFR